MEQIINHLKENWIKYAFETLVVVVGILVAFSLTNWNEARKTAAEEQEVLRLLYEDFINSKEQSESLINDEKIANRIIRAALSDKKIVDSLFSLPPSHEIENTIFWNFVHEAPVFRVYMDLKSSGRTNIIRSHDLRRELTVLEEEIQGLSYVLNDRRTVHTMRVDAISVEDINFLPLVEKEYTALVRGNSADYKELLQTQKIRNLVGIKLESSANIIKSRDNLNKQIIQVLSAIEKELK